MSTFISNQDFFKSQLNDCDIIIKRKNNSGTSGTNHDIVYCNDINKSIRQLEKSLRLCSTRLDEFIDGLETYLENDISNGLSPIQKNDR